MPPRAAPFEGTGLVSLLSVSVDRLVFSAPVLWVPGEEIGISDVAVGANPEFSPAGGPATVVPIYDWSGGTPAVGDPWVLIVPLTLFTPAPPASGFSNSAGLVEG